MYISFLTFLDSRTKSFIDAFVDIILTGNGFEQENCFQDVG